MNVRVRGEGTKENPNIIDSYENRARIGCKCNPESLTLSCMWIYHGHDMRCECGHWFQVKLHTPGELGKLPL